MPVELMDTMESFEITIKEASYINIDVRENSDATYLQLSKDYLLSWIAQQCTAGRGSDEVSYLSWDDGGITILENNG